MNVSRLSGSKNLPESKLSGSKLLWRHSDWLHVSIHQLVQRFSCMGLLIAIGCVSGCATKSVAESDVERATLLITDTFGEWQAGESLDAQRSGTPPVYVAEELWLNGSMLESFEITEPGVMFGTNVRFGVKLTCVDKSGSKRVREVKYLVTTTPALTIAREDR